MENNHELWLKRAESALELGKTSRKDNLMYEDLCFQLQQAAEKALKAFLVFYRIDPPRTHSFKILLSLIDDILSCPAEIKRVIELEDYAVQTRYPGDYTPVGKEEYQNALSIAEDILQWVKKNMDV